MPLFLTIYFLSAGSLSIRVTQSMYVSDYPILSIWLNPFSSSDIDRAYGLGLYTLFVPEALALPVPLDAVGVYLQFNKSHAQNKHHLLYLVNKIT